MKQTWQEQLMTVKLKMKENTNMNKTNDACGGNKVKKPPKKDKQ